MANKVRNEIELYEPMRLWLQQYLEDKYRKREVITIDSHAKKLHLFLEKFEVIDYYPQTIGLDIQIDVLGIVKNINTPLIFFIEAKKTQLTLHDLGQLWAYCKLCDPKEAFLFSSEGMGSLNKIFHNLSRTDLLDFGDGKTIKKMQVGKWDISKNAPDLNSLVPKQ